MVKGRVELFLARRISTGGRTNRSLLSVASAAVAVSMAVMVVAFAVITGFRSQITDKLTGFLAHIRVETLQSANAAEQIPLQRNESFEAEVAEMQNFAAIAPYAEKGGLIKSPEGMEAALLKGVDSRYDSLFYQKYLVEGRLPKVGGEERKKEILVSRTLADLLRLKVGGKVEMLFLGSGETGVRRDFLRVSGIYSSGMAEFDRTVTLTDIRNVQRLNGWTADQYSGYEIMASSIDRARELSDEVRVAALYAGGDDAQHLWRTSEVHTSYPYVFDWLATHNVNAAVITVIMLVVALLNMTSALLITVFERTQTIGVLKAVGMRNRRIQSVFLMRSAKVVVKGLLWGNVVGLALVVVQGVTGVVKLDAEAYMLSSVPVAFEWGWWLLLNIGLPVLLLLLLSVPVAIVSRINPDRTLKYQ